MRKTWNFDKTAARALTKVELIARLIVCSAVLDRRAEEAEGEHRSYYADRARQCRLWAASLKEGDRTDLEHIEAGLRKFEGTAAL